MRRGLFGLLLVALAVLFLVRRSRHSEAARPAMTASARSASAVPGADPNGAARTATLFRLRTSTGEPLRGTICTQCTERCAAEQTIRCAPTDASGVLDTALNGGIYRVHGSASGFLPAWVTYDASGKDARAVEILLAPGGVRVAGRVVVHGDSSPVPQASLQGFDSAGSVVTATTGRDGNFEIMVHPGPVTVVSQAEGYTTDSRIVAAPAADVILRLVRGATLAGRVESAGGAPLALPMIVSAVVQAAEAVPGDTSALAESDGRFEITGLRPGLYRLFARGRSAHGELATPVTLALGEARDDLRIVVSRGHTLAGTVLVSGKACETGEIELSSPTGGRSSRNVGSEVVVEGLSSGKYWLSGRCAGRTGWTDLPPVEIADADVSNLEWKLDEGAKVTGFVRDSTGHGVAGIQVHAADRSRRPGEAETDSTGKYEILGVTAGEVTVSATEVAHTTTLAEETVTLAPGAASEVNLTIATGTLTVRVARADGAPATGVKVLAQNAESGAGESADEAGTGTYIFGRLPAGRYVVTAKGETSAAYPAPDDEAYRREETVAEVSSGGASELRITLPDDRARLEGIVQDGSRNPVPGCRVRIARTDEGCGSTCGAETDTDELGRFVFSGLRARTVFNVTARTPTGASADPTAARPGDRVLITLLSERYLGGRVEGGGDMGSLQVVAFPRGENSGQNAIISGNTFTAAVKEGAPYTISGRTSDGFTGSVAVTADDVTIGRGIVLRLGAPATATGRVVLAAAGDEPLDVDVMASGSDMGSGPTARVRAGERFELRGVPAGSREMKAYANRRGRVLLATKSVVLNAGQTTDVGDVALVETPFTR